MDHARKESPELSRVMYLVQVDDSEWGYEISLVESYSLLITRFSICRTLADQ